MMTHREAMEYALEALDAKTVALRTLIRVTAEGLDDELDRLAAYEEARKLVGEHYNECEALQ